MKKKYKTATKEQVLEWLKDNVFTIDDEGNVHKGDRLLSVTYNTRTRSQSTDPRVHLYHQGHRKSLHVSHLVWMNITQRIVPDGFEIHHVDEDSHNNVWSNLVCVYGLDHSKLHGTMGTKEEIPF